jgi:4-aminobutyrate aminotransferase
MKIEKELAMLSDENAPNIITKTIPGPKAEEYLNRSIKKESMARGGGRFPFVFDSGKGATVRDPDGNTYIDITAGVGVNSVGRCHPRVIEAMETQMRKLMHASDCSSTHRTELAEKVASVMPSQLRDNCITYFTQSGSGAIETAIKFVRKITGKSQIAAFHGAYHGVWCGAGSLTTGETYRSGFGPHIPGVIHLPYPYCYRCAFGLEYPGCKMQCAKYVDYVLNTPYTAADDVGALIMEIQQGEGGYVSVPPEYFPIVKEACDKHGTLFIADEVQSGAGRTGKMWCVEHTEIEPDMIIWGKGMGGDMPMAGLTMKQDLAEKISDHSQSNTFAANGVSAAACMANIDILTEENGLLIQRAADLGEEIKDKVKEAAKGIPIIGDVRGRGLMIGIEMVKSKESKEPLGADDMGKIVTGMLNRGMIMVPCGRFGNVFRFMPPLVVTKEHAFKAVDILIETIKAFD